MPSRVPAFERPESLHFAQRPTMIEASSQVDEYRIHLRGELDLVWCPDLERELEEAEHSSASRIVVDIEDLEFLDLPALRVLVRASTRSASNGGRLRITAGRGQVAKLFRLTPLGEELPLTSICVGAGAE
jgi:anti-anti-sigma factor